MSRPSLVLAGACYLAIACNPKQQAPEATSVGAVPSASNKLAEAKVPAKLKYVSARQYLPAGCDVAAEVDVQALLKNPLIGPQLLTGLVPPTDPQLRAQVMADPDQASFLGFLEAAKIEPQRDLKTVALCMPERTDGTDTRYLAIIAGEFPDGLVEIFRDHAPPGKQYTVESLGKARALFREGKWASQGTSNAILFGNDKDLILAAREPSKAFESYDLSNERDITVTLSEKSLASIDGPANDPLVALLRRGKRVQLSINLEAGDLKGAVTLADAKAVDEFESAIATLRTQMKLQSQQAPPQLRRMMQPSIDLLEKTQLTKDGKQLKFSVALPAGMPEAALQQVLMAAFGAGGPPSAPGNMMAAMAPGQARRPLAAAARPPRRAGRAARPAQQARAPQSAAPLAPLPNLPSFQLTPPPALQGKSLATTPPVEANTPAPAQATPRQSGSPGG